MDESRARTIDRISLAALIALWALTLYEFLSPLALGEKTPLLVLPVVATLIFGVVHLTVSQRYTWPSAMFLIPIDRLPAVAPLRRQYQRLARMVLMVGFVALSWAIFQNVSDGSPVPTICVSAAIVVTVLSLIGWYYWRAWQMTRRGPSTSSG